MLVVYCAADMMGLQRIEGDVEADEPVPLKGLPKLRDAQDWLKLMFPMRHDGGQHCESALLPTVELVCKFSHVAATKILRHIQAFIETSDSDPSTWFPSCAAWLYALFLRIDVPLAPDIASDLRALARGCAALRAKWVRGLSCCRPTLMPHPPVCLLPHTLKRTQPLRYYRPRVYQQP